MADEEPCALVLPPPAAIEGEVITGPLTAPEWRAAVTSREASKALGLHFWTVEATTPEEIHCEHCGRPYLGGGPIPPRCPGVRAVEGQPR